MPIERFGPEPVESKEKKLEIAAKSIPSFEHPERDEDAMFKLPEAGAFGIFDGMGGYSAGDIASKMARDYIAAELKNLPRDSSAEQALILMGLFFRGADHALRVAADKDPKKKNMGTTAAVVKIIESADGKRIAVVANIGDSRAYILRKGMKNLAQITLDHSSAFKNLDGPTARKLQEKFSNMTDSKILTQEEQRRYAVGNMITRALGRGSEPDIRSIPVNEGDVMLLTTDGVHDNLTKAEMEEIMTFSSDTKEMTGKLTAAAFKRSKDSKHFRAKPDDISAIAAEIK